MKKSVIIEYMVENDLWGFGSQISESKICELLDIEIPKRGTREEFDEINLKILSEMGHVKNALLKEHKTIIKTKGVYRIPLKSESEAIASNYLNQSKRKLKKADAMLIRSGDHRKVRELRELAARHRQAVDDELKRLNDLR